MINSYSIYIVKSSKVPSSHMLQMISESLSVVIQGENSQRILLKSDHR